MPASGVDLYWLPLGAGGHFVRLNGRAYEALVALRERRPARDLYHSALVVRLAGERFVVEVAPIPDRHGARRGAVTEGPVGARWAGRWRIFRYEVRRWPAGSISDVDEAVESPRRLTGDERCARRLLDLVPDLPPLVWGRDELGTGEMWNCNSVISWLIARSGIAGAPVRPPAGGRAPGWQAGLTLAQRQAAATGAGPHDPARRPEAVHRVAHHH